MDSLTAASPCAGLLPIEIGAMRVVEVAAGPIASVTPFEGASKPALDKALGMAFPAPLQTSLNGEMRCIWVGQGEALLMGAAPAGALAAHAAVVDQSDMWAVVSLEGPRGADVLARLCPVDLRVAAFPVGATVRTKLEHLNTSVTRTADHAIMIAVYRSLAVTLVHDLTRALEAVAARG